MVLVSPPVRLVWAAVNRPISAGGVSRYSDCRPTALRQAQRVRQIYDPAFAGGTFVHNHDVVLYSNPSRQPGRSPRLRNLVQVSFVGE